MAVLRCCSVRASVALFNVVLGLAPAAAADWPGWRGPSRDAVSTETGLLQDWGSEGPPLAWMTSGIGTGYSSVAVVGARIYATGDRDGAQRVFALERERGRIVWQADLGPAFEERRGGGPGGTPVVNEGRVHALAIAGGHLYVREQDHLYSYVLRAGTPTAPSIQDEPRGGAAR